MTGVGGGVAGGTLTTGTRGGILGELRAGRAAIETLVTSASGTEVFGVAVGRADSATERQPGNAQGGGVTGCEAIKTFVGNRFVSETRFEGLSGT